MHTLVRELQHHCFCLAFEQWLHGDHCPGQGITGWMAGTERRFPKKLATVWFTMTNNTREFSCVLLGRCALRSEAKVMEWRHMMAMRHGGNMLKMSLHFLLPSDTMTLVLLPAGSAVQIDSVNVAWLMQVTAAMLWDERASFS